MIGVPELAAEMKRIEPALEEVMAFHPAPGPRGWRLRGSVCGFASNVLAKYLQATGLSSAAKPIIRRLDAPLTDSHVVVQTERAVIDPTYSQFMKVIGLDAALAARRPDVAALYPMQPIAVIPRGYERRFGERFAEHTMARALRMPRGEQPAGNQSADELFEALADIWNPTRYSYFDNAGDGEFGAQRAAAEMRRLADQNPGSVY